MHSTGFQFLLTIVALVPGFFQAWDCSSRPGQDIVKRHDYEPGDTHVRQTDINPEAFYPTDEEDQIRYIYKFLYYNHQ